MNQVDEFLFWDPHYPEKEKQVTLKQQLTEKLQTQTFLSIGSHLHPTHGKEEP